MDENLRREIIMEHYKNPLNRYKPNNDSYHTFNTRNASCIDNLDIYILFSSDRIIDICFEGEACAISLSSTSIMIKNLIGKTFTEAKEYLKNFSNMIHEKEYDKDLLNEALAYSEIYKQGNRLNCAYLPYKGLEDFLNSQKK